MTKSEAIAFFKGHEQWLAENWSMSPEGRDYAKNFHAAIEAFEPHKYLDIDEFLN
jgi:hypothetical protein